MKKTIQERFEIYHEKNPHVYTRLCGVARTVKARGYSYFGIAPCWEQVRWLGAMTIDTEERYKLTDTFKSRYARFIMEHNPDLEGFFRIKGLRRI